jgi:signal peptidase I
METQDRAEKRRSYRTFILVILSVFGVILLRLFVVRVYKVPSGSMEDTLLLGDRVLVAKFIYGVYIPAMGCRRPGYYPTGDVVSSGSC